MNQVAAQLAVVIVSYNTRDLLRDCLRTLLDSLAADAQWLSATVIVVDNASSDGSAAMVAAEFPTVHLEALARNLGFTGGNNHALALLGLVEGASAAPPTVAAPDFVLLLNPDTRILADAPAQLVRFMQRNPNAGICGAGLRFEDGAFQDAAFTFPNVAQVALDLLPLDRLRGGARCMTAV